ncbi:hypothetical protein CKO_04966 [Citrobacter koseri ATCC BAA-895]|uniref:Uncharacterized protein n=1 Tax=Citrobacter koseri (strain ATCC BAA-895 / CDC 4225-83 / SGSC4696) TaxID=290338 RepID=A8AR97_CITK8|nr:hypothetical protein CKO_04966 [Citrobacter koseri ATCC BAA-895]
MARLSRGIPGRSLPPFSVCWTIFRTGKERSEEVKHDESRQNNRCRIRDFVVVDRRTHRPDCDI